MQYFSTDWILDKMCPDELDWFFICECAPKTNCPCGAKKVFFSTALITYINKISKNKIIISIEFL